MRLDFDRQALKLDAERGTLNMQVDHPNRKAVESSAKIVVLVLGMHRSGTSSVAGALIRLGGGASQFAAPAG